MLTAFQKRLNREEDGFTLIELMVVVLIIGILIAIAIPTFLGAQDRARDKAAQSDLRNGITAAKTIATDTAGLFTNVTATNLGTAEGSLSFAATGTKTVIGVVSATVVDDAVLLYRQSASGKWYGMAASRTGDVGYCSGTGATAPAAVTTVTVDTTGNLSACNGAAW